jgi:hypothetical protein
MHAAKEVDMSSVQADNRQDGEAARTGTVDMKLDVDRAKEFYWPDWYAAYMVAERAGEELPT